MGRRYPGVTPVGEGDSPGMRRFRIRCEVRHPKTDRVHEIDRVIEAPSAKAASTRLVSERDAWLAQRGAARPAAKRRLGKALDDWLASKKSTIKPSTAATYATAVAWWKEVLGDFLVDAIVPDDVRGPLEVAAEEGDATDTVNGRLRVMRTFARAEGLGRIVEGVAAIPRTVAEDEADEDEGRGLDVVEFRRLLAAIAVHAPKGRKGSGKLWRPLLTLIAWTGMRFGEATALEWRDVDLEAGTVRVRRAQWRGIVGHPKARASKRDVAIVEEVVEVLREHRLAAQRAQEALEPVGLVFPSAEAEHGYLSNTGLRKNMLAVCAAAKDGDQPAPIELGDRPALHCLRHTMNNLVRQHASELVRQAIIGHADEAIGETYSKVGADEKRAAMVSVRRVVRGLPG